MISFKVCLLVVYAAIIMVWLNEVSCTIHDKQRQEPVRKGFRCFVRELRRRTGGSGDSTPARASGSASQRSTQRTYLNLLTLEEYHQIQKDLYNIDENDYCPSITLLGERRGPENCVGAFKKFLRVPFQFRGACAKAVRAECHPWHCAEEKRLRCSFFVQTSPAKGLRSEKGQWQPIIVCADGMQKDPPLPRAKPISGPGSTSGSGKKRNLEVVLKDNKFVVLEDDS